MNSGQLERAYRTFVRWHHIVREATSEPQMLTEVCESAVNDLGFRLAWVGLLSEGDYRVRVGAQAGYEAGYLESVVISWSDDEQGMGPTGRAIRERRTAVSREIATDDRFAPWRADALQRGYASSAAIPLCDGAVRLGALNIYAAEPDAFDDDEIALLEEVAVDLVLGIVRLRTAQKVEALRLSATRAAEADTASMVAATVAHDVNNLLQVISLSLESALLDADPKVREALEDATAATSSASTLLRQLQSLTRRAMCFAGHTDVDQIVGGLRHLLTRLAPGASLTFDLGATGLRGAIASVEVERILINLVVNAAQACSSGGTVAVSTGVRQVGLAGLPISSGTLAAGDYIELLVADQGDGIAPGVLPHIFTPYFTTKGEAGTGLGLPSVRHIAETSGGGAWVESAVGEGTRIGVLLPVANTQTNKG
jgi:signal transduction histidine kinase